MKPASGSLVPDNSAPRAVAPPGPSHSAGGEAQPALNILQNQNVRTTGIQIPSPPTASRIRHLPTTRLAGATYRSIRVTDLATVEGHEGQAKHLSCQQRTFVDHGSLSWGSRPLRAHGAPQRTRCNGSGHLFPFSYRRGPNRPVVSSTPRSALCCLWSMTGLLENLRQCRRGPPSRGNKGCWLLRGKKRNHGTALLPFSL